MELDTCTSSDALLMNIFCYPGLSRDCRVPALLGTDPGASLCFGYKARVPLVDGRFDRTEVDLRLGNVLVEAKLTEGDFQSAGKAHSWHIAISRRCSTGSNFSRRMTTTSPTNSQERARGLCSGLFLLCSG